jgi:hypothetical protein
MNKTYQISRETGLVREIKAAVVRNGVHKVFAARLRRASNTAKYVVIASPWITESSKGGSLDQITKILSEKRIPTYVFVRPPETEFELQGIQLLINCPTVELVYNPHLHAKLYTCIAPYPYGFALLGSANMTVRSNTLYEIGLLVLAAGGGEVIIKELASFGMDYLRTRPESLVVKRMLKGR